LLRMYTKVGKATERELAKKTDASMLLNATPPIWQTPGRLQYYKAENEPFIPDQIKWAVRMPNRYAVRTLSYRYEDEVQEKINSFVGTALPFDYMQGNRELNLDLTLKEASHMYSANDNIKSLAQSGELQALHARFSELGEATSTGYVQVMDQLDRVL